MLLLSPQKDIKVVFHDSIFGELSSQNTSSVVTRFLLNPFCSSDSCASYHGLICSTMILIISLYTVDSMQSPLYLLGSDFDHFPFHRVFGLNYPQKEGRSRFDHMLFANLPIIWGISGCSHFLVAQDHTLILAFFDFNWWIVSESHQWLVLRDSWESYLRYFATHKQILEGYI